MSIKKTFSFITSLLSIGTASVVGADVPYFTDFENGVGPEWSSPSLESSESYFT
jgi:hypothetical protein